MVLSLPAGWQDAVEQAAIEPIWYVEIECRAISGGGTNTFGFVSGGHVRENHMPSISHIEAVGAEIDPVTRRNSVEDVHIYFIDDGALREVLLSNFVKGKKVTVKLGTPDLAIANYLAIGVYVVDEISIAPGQLALMCTDGLAYYKDVEISGAWLGRHPLAMIEKLLEDGQIPTSLYDSTTLDDTADTAKSHWMISRYQQGTLRDNTVHNPTPVFDLISEIVELVYGTWVMDPTTGKFKFSFYDDTAAVDRDWTADDIADFQVDSVWANTINTIKIGFGESRVGRPGRGGQRDTTEYNFYKKDSNSVDKMGLQGEEGIFSYSIDGSWLNAIAMLVAPSELPTTAGDGDTFAVGLVNHQGFAGTNFRWFYSGTSPVIQPSAYPLSTTRLGYIALMYEEGALEETEIIEVKGSGYDTTPVGFPLYQGSKEWFLVNNKRGWQTYQAYTQWNFTIKTRGFLGTSTVDWSKYIYPTHWIKAVDVTLAVRLYSQLLARFTRGAPTATVRTNLRHADLEIGDFVTVTHDQYVNHADDGVDTNTVWEIVGKEINVSGDSPGVTWKLCWVKRLTQVFTTSETGGVIGIPATTSNDVSLVDDTGNMIIDNTTNNLGVDSPFGQGGRL